MLTARPALSFCLKKLNRAFFPQKKALFSFAAVVAADFAAGANHPMAGNFRIAVLVQDIADGAPSARRTGSARDFLISQNLSARDAPDDGKNFPLEIFRH
jgi:hypothetical protein